MGYTVYRVYIEQSDYISIYMYKVLCPRTCKSRNKPGGDAQGEGENIGGVRKGEQRKKRGRKKQRGDKQKQKKGGYQCLI